MKNIFLFITFCLLTLISYAENAVVSVLQVDDNTTAFGKGLKAGSIVYDINTDGFFEVIGFEASTETLTTATIETIGVHNPMIEVLDVNDFDIINSNSAGDIEFIAGDGITNGDFVIIDSTDLPDKLSFDHTGGVWNISSSGSSGGDANIAINTNLDSGGIRLQLGAGGSLFLGKVSTSFFLRPEGGFSSNFDIGFTSFPIRDIHMTGLIKEPFAGSTEIQDTSGLAVYRRILAFDNRTAAAPTGIYNPIKGDYGEQVTFNSTNTTGIEIELNATTDFPTLTELHYIIDKTTFPNGMPLTAEGGVTFRYLRGNASILGSEYELKKTATDTWDVWIIDTDRCFHRLK